MRALSEQADLGWAARARLRRTPKPNPFRYDRSSPGVFGLAVVLCVRFPLALPIARDLAHEDGIKIIRTPETGCSDDRFNSPDTDPPGIRSGCPDMAFQVSMRGKGNSLVEKYFKWLRAEGIWRQSSGPPIPAVEMATLNRVEWFDSHRLCGRFGPITGPRPKQTTMPSSKPSLGSHDSNEIASGKPGRVTLASSHARRPGVASPPG